MGRFQIYCPVHVPDNKGINNLLNFKESYLPYGILKFVFYTKFIK